MALRPKRRNTLLTRLLQDQLSANQPIDRMPSRGVAVARRIFTVAGIYGVLVLYLQVRSAPIIFGAGFLDLIFAALFGVSVCARRSLHRSAERNVIVQALGARRLNFRRTIRGPYSKNSRDRPSAAPAVPGACRAQYAGPEINERALLNMVGATCFSITCLLKVAAGASGVPEASV